MPVDRASETELTAYRELIDAWAEEERAANPLVAAVDRDPDLPRWYLRMLGEEKGFITGTSARP